MESLSALQARKKIRLAVALKQNIHRRKAAAVPPEATEILPPEATHLHFDDDEDTTSPISCCGGGCR